MTTASFGSSGSQLGYPNFSPVHNQNLIARINGIEWSAKKDGKPLVIPKGSTPYEIAKGAFTLADVTSGPYHSERINGKGSWTTIPMVDFLKDNGLMSTSTFLDDRQRIVYDLAFGCLVHLLLSKVQHEAVTKGIFEYHGKLMEPPKEYGMVRLGELSVSFGATPVKKYNPHGDTLFMIENLPRGYQPVSDIMPNFDVHMRGDYSSIHIAMKKT
jgi:hypothetical protein